MADASRTSSAQHPSVDDLLAALPPPRTPRRWLRRLLFLVGVAAILVALAPEIVARTPLLQKLIAVGTAEMRGTLALDGASLSWFSTPSLTKLSLVDEGGLPMLAAESISGDRTLWQLLVSPRQLGRYRIVRPEIHIVVRDNGTTNFEYVLEKLLKKKDDEDDDSKSKKKKAPLDAAVEIVDGTLHVHDHRSQRQWTIEQLTTVVVLSGSPQSPLVADLQGALQTAEGPRRWSAQGSWKTATTADGRRLPQGDVAATLEALPLELVEALTRRFVPGLTLGGTAQGDLRARFDFAAATPTGDVSGRLTIAELAVGGAALQGDEVRLTKVDIPLAARLEGERLQIDQLAAQCDLASIAVRGSLDRWKRLLTAPGIADVIDLATQYDGQLTVNVDLARVAQAMPHVVRLRDDVQVTGGQLSVVAASGGPLGVGRQQLEIATSNFTGVAAGRPIAWNEPLRAVISLVDVAGAPTVDRVQCTSDFLTLDGTNTAASFQLAGRCDLAHLAERIGQFIDLGGLQLRGHGTVEGTWQRTAGERFQVDGQAAISDFYVVAPGEAPWTEQQLVVALEASGRTDGLAVAALDAATVGLQAGGDELTVRLGEPIGNVRAKDATWPLVVAGKGRLATWLARVRPLVSLPPTLAADGEALLNATLRVRLPDDFELVQGQLTSQPFQFVGYGVTANEPNAALQMAGRYRNGEWSVSQALLTAENLQAQVRQLVYRGGDARTATELTGEAAVRADLTKLWYLLGHGPAPGAQPTGLQLGGTLDASAQLRKEGPATAIALDATAANLVAAQIGGGVWQEPRVTVKALGQYDPAHDALQIDRLEAAASALRVALAGKIAELSTTRVIACNGELDYDLAALNPLLQPYLGPHGALVGRDSRKFELVGPLGDPARPGTFAADKLSGSLAVGWQRAVVHGFDLGPTTFDAKLNQGLLRVSPTEIAVASGGKLRLAPSLRLGAGPQEIQLDPGIVADHVTMTPDMVNERLKYVMPILAGVAQVGGSFSVTLDELRIPLNNPSAGTLSGRMTVHAVEFGATPILQQLAPVLRQPLSASLRRESVIDFKLVQGRIYHQNMEFAFPDITIKTHGSVGLLDQSLAMTAEVSLPATFLKAVPLVQSAVSNQTIRLPIGGTLSQPGIDLTSLLAATKNIFQNAAQNAVEKGLTRGLDQLLNPKGAALPTTEIVK